VNALSNDKVGDYLNAHFVSAFQKVGTFRISNGQKQGGNVASYFCTPDGQVLHLLAGPVTAEVFLREARWVVETQKLAALEGRQGRADLQAFIRHAHRERLRHEYGRTEQDAQLASPGDLAALLAGLSYQRLPRQERVHILLARSLRTEMGDLYRIVFEGILAESVSTLPVAEEGAHRAGRH